MSGRVTVQVLHASDDSQTKAFQKEISILKSISYDRNIVQFYGAVLTDRPMLVLEYMEGGDLRAALNDDPHGHLRWYNHGQHIALDIARGLHFLHSHDVRLSFPPPPPLSPLLYSHVCVNHLPPVHACSWPAPLHARAVADMGWGLA